MKLYISGPITGVPYSNKPAFRDAEEALRTAGYEVLNPHDIGPPAGYQAGLVWSDYLRKDIIALLSEGVTGIATLANHQRSRGARLECHLAAELDIPVGPVEFWLDIERNRNDTERKPARRRHAASPSVLRAHPETEDAGER